MPQDHSRGQELWEDIHRRVGEEGSWWGRKAEESQGLKSCEKLKGSAAIRPGPRQASEQPTFIQNL